MQDVLKVKKTSETSPFLAPSVTGALASATEEPATLPKSAIGAAEVDREVKFRVAATLEGKLILRLLTLQDKKGRK